MPLVSVIVPCYNEETTIRPLLESLRHQTIANDQMEIVIADGISSDRTVEQIMSFQSDNPALKVKVVTNAKRVIPSGLNQAIKAANGEYVVRLDAHCIPRDDYIERSVSDLQQNLGDNVGGVWEIRPGGKSWLSRAIALAAAHPLAVGDARYRYTHLAGCVDTVPFGAFHKSLVDKIGYFNEGLLTNEDYEFNTRIRQAGGKIWLDPEIRSTYIARADLAALARQYWRYGYWKVRMLRLYPRTIRWRQALPPAFVASLLALGILSFWLPAARWLLLIEAAIYCGLLVLVGVQMAIKHADFGLILGIPLAMMVMHLSWGGAFLWSMIK